MAGKERFPIKAEDLASERLREEPEHRHQLLRRRGTRLPIAGAVCCCCLLLGENAVLFPLCSVRGLLNKTPSALLLVYSGMFKVQGEKICRSVTLQPLIRKE